MKVSALITWWAGTFNESKTPLLCHPPTPLIQRNHKNFSLVRQFSDFHVLKITWEFAMKS